MGDSNGGASFQVPSGPRGAFECVVSRSRLMSRSCDRRVRAGGGGRPSAGGGGGLRSGTGDSAAPAVGVAGGRDARGSSRQRLGHLRYSPGEERAVRHSIEKGLRLQRLEQVRQQSRQHAAAVREEYRERRKENKRAALRESQVCVKN